MKKKGRILFYRTWAKYNGGTSGGQLKVRDAFEHARGSQYVPRIYFPPKTRWFDNPGNHWQDLRDTALSEWEVKNGDLLFFSGKDWEVLSPEERVAPPAPVLNIVQPRQVDLPDIRQEALAYPAIRIVKSRYAKKFFEDYGVKGPVHFIPDAIDLSVLPNPVDKDIDILIVGLKNPVMAQRLFKVFSSANVLSGRQLNIQLQVPPKLPRREDFLSLLNRAKLAVFLPLPVEKGGEGFYLPALEAMAMRTFVVCPDVIGNLDFCIDGETCLMPRYHLWGYMLAVWQYFRMEDEQRSIILDSARQIVDNHTLEKERRAYQDLIDKAYDIWNDSFADQ